MPKRVSRFECEGCGLLHVSAANAKYCESVMHIGEIDSQESAVVTDPYGEPTKRIRWVRTESSIGPVMVLNEEKLGVWTPAFAAETTEPSEDDA